jgi:hypothetical protein|tara:strand:- start:12 stop:233 length:222 start_codon:yes stop_codon:yes gene_type:complete
MFKVQESRKKLNFNAWLLYYGDEIESMLDYIFKELNNKLSDKIFDNNNHDIIFNGFAKIVYDNSHKERPLYNI